MPSQSFAIFKRHYSVVADAIHAQISKQAAYLKPQGGHIGQGKTGVCLCKMQASWIYIFICDYSMLSIYGL